MTSGDVLLARRCLHYSRPPGLSRLGREPGTIEREEWRLQARLLEAGKVREHERRYLEV